MDDRRFDDLTKAISLRTSRRTLLRGAVGALVAGLTGAVIRTNSARAAIPTRPRHCIHAGRVCGPTSSGASRGCCYKCDAATNTCCENVRYACVNDSHCCGALICRDQVAGDGNTQRTCFAPGTLPGGAECRAGAECAAGGCVNGRCCTPENATCSANSQCCTGLVCRGGACRPRGGVGQTCDESADCAPGLGCQNGACCGLSLGACTANSQCCSGLVCRGGVCQPRGATGQVCDENADCQSNACDPIRRVCCQSSGKTCGANSQCCGGLACRGGVCLAPGQLGQVCDEPADCVSGNCDATRRICCVPGASACTANSQCCGGNVCRNGTCQPAGGQGAVCDEPGDCLAGFTCQSATCCAQQNTGCSANSQCCAGLVCRGGACLPPALGGQTCDEDADCAAGTCNGGVCCVAGGAACTANSQCCGTSVCRGGTCQPPGGLGDVCDEAGDCSTGNCDGSRRVCCWPVTSVCTANSDCCGPLVCRNGTCQPLGGLGEVCEEGVDCVSGHCHATNEACCLPQDQICSANINCCEGLVCRGGTCRPPGGGGDICDEDEDCAAGTCTAGVCCLPATSTCTANTQCCAGLVCRGGTCQTAGALGEVCDEGPDCTSNNCDGTRLVCCLPSTQACTANSDCCGPLVCRAGTCQELGVAGDACDASDGNADCAAGHTCAAGTCCAASATSCTANTQCCTGLVCRGGSCQAPGQLDDVCDELADCDTGYLCESGQCCANLATFCGLNEHCCNGLTCYSGLCMSPSDLGGVCDDDGDCLAGTCDAGVCCIAVSIACLSNSQCCAGLVCRGAVCAAPGTAGDACDVLDNDADCADGFECESGACCASALTTCGANTECCPGLVCRDDICQAAGGNGDVCDETADCSGTLVCESGTCCAASSGSCNANDDCCTGLTCIGGACAAPSGLNGTCDDGDDADCAAGYLCESATCCAGSGTTCSIDDDCCTGLECVNSECVNVAPPTANPDFYSTDEATLLSVSAADGVLANDTTPGGTLSVTAFDATSTEGGTVSVAADGSFTYDPPVPFSGEDTFTYTVTGIGGNAVGTVSVFVSVAAPYIGEIRLMSFGFAPRGWMLCHGQILSIANNTALFSLLGTTYGGNGTTTFALPDLRGRVPMHVGSGHTQGESGGQEAHTLTTGALPSHTHIVRGTNELADLAGPEGNLPAQATAQIYNGLAAPLTTLHPATIVNAGSSQSHQNMQPFLTLSFCIATQGIFPPRN